MTENTFPVYKVDAIVNFYRTEVLTGQEAKHFTKSDLTPTPKVKLMLKLMISVDFGCFIIAWALISELSSVRDVGLTLIPTGRRLV